MELAVLLRQGADSELFEPVAALADAQTNRLGFAHGGRGGRSARTDQAKLHGALA